MSFNVKEKQTLNQVNDKKNPSYGIYTAAAEFCQHKWPHAWQATINHMTPLVQLEDQSWWGRSFDAGHLLDTNKNIQEPAPFHRQYTIPSPPWIMGAINNSPNVQIKTPTHQLGVIETAVLSESTQHNWEHPCSPSTLNHVEFNQF